MKNGERQKPADRKNSPSFFSSPFSALYDSCLTLIYPQICQVCEKRGVESRADGVVCRACWRRTRFFGGARGEILCEKCSAFLKESGAAGAEKFVTFCRRCEEDSYDLARAVGLYERALLATVLNLKKTPLVPRRLQNLFFDAFLRSPFLDATRIIPVPLSKRRFKERGFNQAALLAASLAKQTGLPLDEQSLARKIHTPQHRAGMDKKARVESVKNAFEITRPKFIENEKILLVDDVFTSGATADNCARALKKKNARAVYVLTVARAF